MCVTSGPAVLSSTILLASEASLAGETVHVLGYQNTVRNLDATYAQGAWESLAFGRGDRSHSRPQGNAMILPFPAVPGSMAKYNVVSTEQSPKFLEEMAKSVMPQTRYALFRSAGPSKAVEVFDHGIYTVVLASAAHFISDALEQVPPEKQPKIGEGFFDAYDRLYAGWTIALCCFNNADAKRSTPLLWWYRPMNPDSLFAPALDAHDGRPPDVNAQVEVDHTVLFGSHLAQAGHEVYFAQEPDPEVKRLLPSRIVGSPLHRRLPNGDFTAPVENVRRGELVIYRQTPGHGSPPVRLTPP